LEKHDTRSSGGVIKNPQAQISRVVVIKRKKEMREEEKTEEEQREEDPSLILLKCDSRRFSISS
jgi:hypothetical protein